MPPAECPDSSFSEQRCFCAGWSLFASGLDPLGVFLGLSFNSRIENLHTPNTTHQLLPTPSSHCPHTSNYLSVTTDFFLFPQNTSFSRSHSVLIESSQSSGAGGPQWDLTDQLILLLLPRPLQLIWKNHKLRKPTAIDIPFRSLQWGPRELNTVRNFTSLSKTITETKNPTS